MNDERTRSYMQNRLGKYCHPVDNDLWSSLSGSIPPRKSKRLMPYLLPGISAAVIALVLFLFSPSGKREADLIITDEAWELETLLSPPVGETMDIGGGAQLAFTGVKIKKNKTAVLLVDTTFTAVNNPEQEKETSPVIKDNNREQGESPEWSATFHPAESSAYSPYCGEQFRRNKKIALLLAVNGSSSSSFLSREGEPPEFSNGGFPIYTDDEIKETYHLPLSFSLTIRKGLSRRFAIETGLTYTYIHTTLDIKTKEEKGPGNIKLHYLGIPLKGIYTLYTNHRVSFYTGAGGMVEKQIAGRLKLPSENRRLVYSGLQWSAGGFAGVHLKLNKSVGLFVEPGISYYFNDGSNIPTIRKDKPLNFNFQIGTRFNMK